MSHVGGKTQRVPAIDIARALVIVGVVFSHAIDGLVGAGFLTDASPIVIVNDALYIFRMPALAFLLGLFIPNAVLKRGPRGFIRERVTFALYLYVVWFFTQTFAEILSSSVKNTPRGWTDLLAIWSMPAHLWFLPYLALSAVIVAALVQHLTSRRGWWFLGLLAVLGLLCWGNSPAVFGLRGLSLLMFTAAGAMLGLDRAERILAKFPFWCMASGCVSMLLFIPLFAAGMVPSTINGQAPKVLVSALSAAGAGLGVIAVLGLAVALNYFRPLRGVLTAIGARTLEIFLAHVAIVAGVRIALERMGIVQVPVFIFVSMLIGVGAPVLVSSLAPRIGLKWLFQPPAKIEKWSKGANLVMPSANFRGGHAPYENL